MKMPSVMRSGGKFAKVPQAEIPRSQFNRSHGHKTTFDAGSLVPIYLDEALPGDTFNMSMAGFARLATPLKPLMDNLYLDTFFFAVPYRLVWDNWEKFNGAQRDPGDSISFTIPQATVPAGGYTAGRLLDYMGVPPGLAVTAGWTHSCLPVRAYYLIWNEWFRDQNLQDSRDERGVSGASTSHGDGPDIYSAGGPTLAVRGKRHDYFTSCLPSPQRGTAIDVPFTGLQITSDGVEPTFKSAGAGSAAAAKLRAKASTMPADIEGFGTGTWTAGEGLEWDDPHLDITGNMTINSLREAFQIQKLLERDARGGTRYVEVIKSHFGVTSPDARLQRTEYLGGGTSPIVVSPIAQTSETLVGTPQANLSAIGTGTFGSHGFVKSFTEHCLIIGLVCARADLTYQYGLDKSWRRSTRYDFYWPAFAHLGEQSVLNEEIYLQDDLTANAAVFGYQERFAEYRYKPSLITGQFRSEHASTLDIWHLCQEFASLPVLDDTFIQENPPIDRTIAVPAEPHFILDTYSNLICARPMPMYSVPGLIDHF